jgi:hypothetical protein
LSTSKQSFPCDLHIKVLLAFLVWIKENSQLHHLKNEFSLNFSPKETEVTLNALSSQFHNWKQTQTVLLQEAGYGECSG